MSKKEFDAEWRLKVSGPAEVANVSPSNWYAFAEERIKDLSPEAQDFILDSPEIGDWVKEACVYRALERAFKLNAG